MMDNKRDWGWLLIGLSGMGLLVTLLIIFGVLQYNPLITAGQSNFMKINSSVVCTIVLIYSIYLIRKNK
jgi:formate-dependent nitrite reductase membrane component NrfD